MKHNKKRNTAFLYESLVKELTKSIVKKDSKRKTVVVNILKENFYKNSILNKDLGIYKSILENKDKMTKDFSIRFLAETKKDFYNLDRKKVFNAQTKLLESINKKLSPDVYKNFIPNYKSIATVGQWFNSENMSAKSRLLIETKVVGILSPQETIKENMKHIDSLTYKTFVNKFNQTYDKTLKENQKALLTNYIVSFSDNGLGLKTFMNEEIGRLKSRMKEIIAKESVNESSKYLSRSKEVLEKLESFKDRQIDESMVKTLFYIQNLAEVVENGRKS